MGYKPLLLMRKKGLLGNNFGNYAGIRNLAKSVGSFFDVNTTPIETSYALKLNGTNYAELSEPKAFAGDFEWEFSFNSTDVAAANCIFGDSSANDDFFRIGTDNTYQYKLGGSYVVTGVVATQDEKVELLIRRIAARVWIYENKTTPIKEDYPIPTSDISISHLFIRADGIDKFVGTPYSVDLTDLATPANSIKWNIDSGLAKYETGAEQVINGDFSDGINNWTPTNQSQLSVVDGRLRILNAAVDYGKAYQGFTTVIGEAYVVSLDGFDGTDLAYVRMGTSPTAADILPSQPGVGFSPVIIIAETTTTYIALTNANNTQGVYTEWDNISVKQYIDTISDGTIYQDSETFGTLPDIMRADDWGTAPTGVTVSGRTATFDGTQVTAAGVGINLSEQYTGLHYVVYKVTNLTLGSVRLNDSENAGGVAHTANGVYSKYLNPPTGGSFRVVDDGANADRFTGSVEIISIKPVPEGLIMQGVVEADWFEV